MIVVDDCSSDRSLACVQDFDKPHGRLRIIRHTHNKGVGAARNSIIAHAQGEFIAFFDDDDESYPDRVQRQIGVLTEYETEASSALIACYAGGERRYQSGYVVSAPAIGQHGLVPHGPAVAAYLLAFRRTPGWFYGAGVPACALLARRSTFEMLGGFDPDLRRLEDVDFAIRLALQHGHFLGTPQPLYTRHMTEGVDKSAEAVMKANVAIADKHADFLRSIGFYHYARRWPRLRYWHSQRNYMRLFFDLCVLFFSKPSFTTGHLFTTGPARLRHEARMAKGTR